MELISIPHSQQERESATGSLLTPGPGPLRLCGRPTVSLHVDPTAIGKHAFCFEQLDLFHFVRLGHQHTSARADHPMPWDALTIRARRHRVADRPRAPAKPQSLG